LNSSGSVPGGSLPLAFLPEGAKATVLDYGDVVEANIRLIEGVLCEKPDLSRKYPQRWLAIKLIEGDERILEMAKAALSEPQMAKIQEAICHE
jgi:hypothetical protein